MAKRLLVIDGANQGPFFLSFAAGTMTIGGNPKESGVVLRDLHLLRIQCEVEVKDELVVVRNAEATPGTLAGAAPLRQELRPGEALPIGPAHLRLEAADAGEVPATAAVTRSEPISKIAKEAPAQGAGRPAESSLLPAATARVAASPQQGLAKRLHVIDGADQGRFFFLPETGTVTIGKSHKHAEIVLNDLYVSRVHCELQMEEDTVLVKHLTGQHGTLINGQPITEQQLQMGDVLRVGNSHLRLETAVGEDRPAGGSDDPGFEILEEEAADEAAEPEEASLPGYGEAFALPHAPVDQLLQLEDQTLGHFQIGPLLGRGQTSLVFRAQDLKKNQVVALKVLSPDFPKNDAELQRFVQALKIVPNLRHIHLVTLYGAGKSGLYCWIAREYVEGESLTRLITRLKEGGKFDWTRACRVAVHLGQVLEFLHQHGVTHGNITPRNILLPHGDKPTKLTDLMLNKALEGSLLQKAVVAKKLLLELPYLAPEQADPYTPAAPHADLYSLGTVLYALLTGQPPFSGDSPKEIIAQVREAKMVKPSTLQKGIPGPFEAAVLKMMARSPADRFQTAAELLAVVKPIAHAHEIKVFEGGSP